MKTLAATIAALLIANALPALASDDNHRDRDRTHHREDLSKQHREDRGTRARSGERHGVERAEKGTDTDRGHLQREHRDGDQGSKPDRAERRS